MLNDNKYHERSMAARKSTLISVVVNLMLSLFQIITGIFSGSQGLIADGIHSLSDLVADFVVLIASKKSRMPPDSDHPYGHWRYENGASMILGVILMAVGAGMLWSAAGKLLNPAEHPAIHTAALWMALAAMAIKEVLFRYMLSVATRIRSSLLIANAWHARSDAASSVVVAVGITGALAGSPWFDPLAALLVGVVIFRMGYRFTSEAMHDLMDRSADADKEGEIKNLLLSTPGVAGLHDLRTRRAGDYILVDVHLEIPAHLSVRDGHDIAVAARERVLQDPEILNVMVHIDPLSTPVTGQQRSAMTSPT
ncbi:cation transporter [Enterobacter hormaechei]|uniref:cation diffusion facilitator family transporter n=1 Tax=Enterobacter hormaechei TaxID=158836 RepID=UPI0005F8B5CD|nr:cation diffusion facilitator family transporter [Enterobacter hormaechei]EKZ5806912.1 cation transporter [Klebsiella variicola]ELD3473125.1 cation transporter [Enterobacter hormaechei]ELD3487821.1 cation transporter [Enterobacter hormaechei]KJX14647.1 cobalt transporter [Enterobacter hormaechei subsp. xiangfangensis]HCT5211528.1 cation transporter [Enterobacter hormaechei]